MNFIAFAFVFAAVLRLRDVFRPAAPCWLMVASCLVSAGAPSAGGDAAIQLETKLPPHLSAGDIQLGFAAPPSVSELIVFYGDGTYWNVRLAVPAPEGFAVTLYDYRSSSLHLRFYAETKEGEGHWLDGPQLDVPGGTDPPRADDSPPPLLTTGFNFIPNPAPDEPENARTLRELARLGFRDLLVNLYTPHFTDLLPAGGLDRLLTLADALEMRLWLVTREVESLHQPYFHQTGWISSEEAERYAFTYVLTRHHWIPPEEPVVSADTADFAEQWTLPSNTAKDVLYVKACVYDPNVPDPMPSAIFVPEDNIRWTVERPGDPHGKPLRISYIISGLEEHLGKCVTVQIGVRTLRLWTLPPVWDDDYYERFYKPKIADALVDQARLKDHPSVHGIATINEPTFTWQGGDLFHPAIENRWQEFILARYGTMEKAAQALGWPAAGPIPFLPRLVYAGAPHTGWSGEPGKAGLSSAYELCKSDFKESLMALIIHRTIDAFRRRMPDKEFFVKFQHGGSSNYALETQQYESALRLPEVSVMAYDSYPLGYHPEGKPASPAAAAPAFLWAAGYGGLAGAAFGKPAWAAETNFGRAHQYEKETADATRLMLDILAAGGLSRSFIWAISPSWSKEDPYRPSGGTFEERARPALLRHAEFLRANQSRRVRTPHYDIVVLTPRTDSILWAGNKDHYQTNTVRDLVQELWKRGLTAANGPLTPETAAAGKAILLPGGYYLSEKERNLLMSLSKPVLILAPAYVTNPIDGAGSAWAEWQTLHPQASPVRTTDFQEAPATPRGRVFPLVPPEGATLLESAFLNKDNAVVATVFGVADRITCTSDRAPAEAADLAHWWFLRLRKTSIPATYAP